MYICIFSFSLLLENLLSSPPPSRVDIHPWSWAAAVLSLFMWQLWHSELRRNWRPAAPCGVTVTVMKYLWLPFLAGTPFSAFLLYLGYINFVKLTLSHIASIPHCTLEAAFLHLNADTRYFQCIDIQYLCVLYTTK